MLHFLKAFQKFMTLNRSPSSSFSLPLLLCLSFVLSTLSYLITNSKQSHFKKFWFCMYFARLACTVFSFRTLKANQYKQSLICLKNRNTGTERQSTAVHTCAVCRQFSFPFFLATLHEPTHIQHPSYHIAV